MALILPLLAACAGLLLGSVLWITCRAFAVGELPHCYPACPHCAGDFDPVAWWPIYGSVIARCANCRRKMGIPRLLLETGLGAAFAIAAIRLGFTRPLLEILLFSIPLVAILLTDFWTGTVFRNLALFGIILGVGFAAVGGTDSLLGSIYGALAGVALFGITMLAMRKLLPAINLAPIGGGDVLIAGMIGAMAHWPGIILALFAGVLMAGIGAVVILGIHRHERHPVVPFGPFLCAAAIPVFVFWF